MKYNIVLAFAIAALAVSCSREQSVRNDSPASEDQGPATAGISSGPDTGAPLGIALSGYCDGIALSFGSPFEASSEAGGKHASGTTGAAKRMVFGSFALDIGWEGALAVYSAADGRLLWEEKDAVGAPAASEKAIAFIQADGTFTVRALADGSSFADIPLAGIRRDVAPAFDGRLYYVALSGGRAAAIDLAAREFRWLASIGMEIDHLVCDPGALYAFGADDAVALSPEAGRPLARVALPARSLERPVLDGGTFGYRGLDGRLYRNPVPDAAGTRMRPNEEEGMARAIRFRLDKYINDHTALDLFGPFLPYVDMAPHDGILPFTVFRYTGPSEAMEMSVELSEADGSAPRNGIVAVFNEQGDEIRANVDEFGTHASFAFWFDPGKEYYLAVGRRDAGMPPLFLVLRKP